MKNIDKLKNLFLNWIVNRIRIVDIPRCLEGIRMVFNWNINIINARYWGSPNEGHWH